MKKFLLLTLVALFMISLLIGCGQEAETPAEDSGAGQPEEVADTTRLDSADVGAETPVDTATATEAEAEGGGE